MCILGTWWLCLYSTHFRCFLHVYIKTAIHLSNKGDTELPFPGPPRVHDQVARYQLAARQTQRAPLLCSLDERY